MKKKELYWVRVGEYFGQKSHWYTSSYNIKNCAFQNLSQAIKCAQDLSPSLVMSDDGHIVYPLNSELGHEIQAHIWKYNNSPRTRTTK